jgi:hypothetical protein
MMTQDDATTIEVFAPPQVTAYLHETIHPEPHHFKRFEQPEVDFSSPTSRLGHPKSELAIQITPLAAVQA